MRRRVMSDKYEYYEVVNYLESTGTQYIDTGIAPKDITKWEIGTYNNPQRKSQYMGSGSTSLNTRFRFGNNSVNESNIFFDIGTAGYYISYSSKSFTEISYEWINKSPGRIKISNITYGSSSEKNTTVSVSEYKDNIALFALNDSGKIKQYTNARVYYSRIYVDNSLIQDFIPCRRLSDGVLGMYDRVTGKFYTNQGTDEFIAGNATGEIIKVRGGG